MKNARRYDKIPHTTKCGVITVRIAICDDENLCRKQVLAVATDYAEERQDQDIVFEMFSEPEALLQAAKEKGHYDIYILDIVMPGMNGIQLGQALRDSGCDSKIIYLTSSQEYAVDSFRVRAFHYLLKPIRKEAFFAALDEAISSISIRKDRSLIIKTKSGNARITFDSILYAELSRRTVVYHLSGGRAVESTSLRTNFSDSVQELLADKRFALCGASMAANLHHITAVENEGIVFQDSTRVFLGKKACRELRTVWNDYWLSKEEL